MKRTPNISRHLMEQLPSRLIYLYFLYYCTSYVSPMFCVSRLFSESHMLHFLCFQLRFLASSTLRLYVLNHFFILRLLCFLFLMFFSFLLCFIEQRIYKRLCFWDYKGHKVRNGKKTCGLIRTLKVNLQTRSHGSLLPKNGR